MFCFIFYQKMNNEYKILHENDLVQFPLALYRKGISLFPKKH